MCDAWKHQPMKAERARTSRHQMTCCWLKDSGQNCWRSRTTPSLWLLAACGYFRAAAVSLQWRNLCCTIAPQPVWTVLMRNKSTTNKRLLSCHFLMHPVCYDPMGWTRRNKTMLRKGQLEREELSSDGFFSFRNALLCSVFHWKYFLNHVSVFWWMFWLAGWVREEGEVTDGWSHASPFTEITGYDIIIIHGW